ncbi:MAG: stage III sporulation protein AE [Intestinibacter sp.]
MKNKLKIVLITLFFIISMNNISFASQNDENKNDLSTEEYEVSNETSQNYKQAIEKINIGQLKQELKNNELFKDLNLKQYKDLIKGETKLTDLINIQSLKNLILQQLSASLKVIIMIIVLALLSSILKSLESSFSSGEVTKIVNYIIFITMVTLVLVNFKDVLSIAYTTVNSIISIVNILIPILLSLMVVGGLTATSATLSPVFVGGISNKFSF